MKKVKDKNINQISTEKELIQEAIKAECLGWYLKMTRPGLLAK